MKLTLRTSTVVVAAIVLVVFQAQTASAAFMDSFETYSVGNVDGQGPWVDFGGAKPTEVTNTIAHTGDQSLQLELGPAVGNPFEPGYGSDVYANLAAPETTGQWVLSWWQYVPSSYDGASVTYASEQAIPTYDEGRIVVTDNRPNGDAGVYRGTTVFPGLDPESPVVPLVFDEWAQHVLNIDLDANTVEMAYNGTTYATGTWDEDADGSTLGAIALWTTFDDRPNPITPGTEGAVMYVDDISLVPEPSSLMLLLTAVALLFRRRR